MKHVLTMLALVLSVSWASAETVNLNIIQVCDDGGNSCAPVNLNQSFTDKIWAQAGTTFNYGSITQLNSTKFLNPTELEADELIGSNIFSGTGRVFGSYDVWFVNSFNGAPGLRGRGAVGGDGVVVSSSSAAVDTLAHELGHNFGQDHINGTIADAGRYLMAAGSIRTIPTGIGDIAPDGLQLDYFNPILPEVTVDMVGATPFLSSDFFDVKFLAGAATDLGLSSLTIDLTPANAFFDVTNAPPGLSGSPFSFGSLHGISAADIAISGLSDGGSILKMDFAADSFTSGDSLSFGMDMDLFSNIDGFGATADELRSSLVTLTFEDGYSVAGDLSTLIFSSVFDPNKYVDVFTSRRGDPLASPVPEPSSIWLLSLGLAIIIGAFRGAKARSLE
ncbi:MAG: PEP-CTERM sorting domain-containing protein [Nitrosomonas oligotropha]|uniref:PEP-CTERM sorting domain-containing protein n=1 Tax=Nitrosomonas oligotropha TaxID=42354 RepID=A0A5C7VY76_9PROT|nr:MAG: PEP-CTERM sorting domain-containing protein [Nitrosomonas oligotropha]